ncbi:MAG TPA: hypothetical protein PLN69_12565 [bacterium]|nr:hypothetical protein [bacterium]
MKKRVMYAAVMMVMLLMGACLVGCSSGKVDVKVETPDGTVEIKGDEKSGNFVVDGEDGKVEMKIDKDAKTIVINDEKEGKTVKVTSDIDTKKLGVDIYPGAEVISGGSMEQTGEGAGLFQGVTLMTGDKVDKVAKFYREKLKGATVVDMLSLQGQIMFNLQQDGLNKSVIVMKDPEGSGKTQIAISVVPGN